MRFIPDTGSLKAHPFRDPKPVEFVSKERHDMVNPMTVEAHVTRNIQKQLYSQAECLEGTMRLEQSIQEKRQ